MGAIIWALESERHTQSREQAIGVRFQWGNVVCTLNDHNFRNGFFRGSESYREEEPYRQEELVATVFLVPIALPAAGIGHYRFDYEGINNFEEYLGVFLGYVTAPLVDLAFEAQ